MNLKRSVNLHKVKRVLDVWVLPDIEILLTREETAFLRLPNGINASKMGKEIKSNSKALKQANKLITQANEILTNLITNYETKD